jgi:uncharacterized protein YcbX
VEIASLRRYPVKSMGGEDLEHVTLDGRGLVGDRWFAVEDGEGHFASGKSTRRFRRRDAVFKYAARSVPGGDVIVTGPGGTWAVGDPALDATLSRAMGTSVAITPERGIPHQDMGHVSLVSTATLAWCASRWGIAADPRRLRVNLVVSAGTPFVEEQWLGAELVVGSARLRVVERVPRCRMIDIDQDGARSDGRWLKPLTAERGQCIAVYADVTVAGEIAVGDEVSLG